MSEPFSVSCPKCKAKLKLKSQAAVGKKIACPKCSHPFVVKPPKVAEEEELSFLDVSEPDDIEDELPEDEEAEDEVESPRSRSAGRRSAGAASSRGGKGKKGKSRPVEWQKPVLIGGLALLLLGGLGGLGYVALSFFQAGEPNNKFDTVFLPPDAETFVQIRPAELLAAPLMNSTLQHPAIKPNMDFLLPMAEGSLGMKLSDIDTVTIGLPGSFDFNQQSVNAVTSGQTEPVIVFKMKQPLPAATRQAGSGYEATTVAGRQVFRPKGAGNKFLVWMADDLRTVMAPEAQIQRLLTQGKTLKRRPDLDFVINDKHMVFAFVPADRAKLDRLLANAAMPGGIGPGAGGGVMPGMPGGGMPGGGMPGMPAGGMPGMPAGGMPGMPGGGMPGGGPPGGGASNPLLGKVTGMTIALQVTSDLLIDAQNQCLDAATATQLVADSKTTTQQAKDAYQKQKTQLQLAATMFSAGEFVPILDEIMNSIDMTSEGPTMTQRVRIPGSLKTAVENFLNSEFFKTLVQNQGNGGGAPPGLPFDPSKILGGLGGFLPGGGGAPAGPPGSLGGAPQPPGGADDNAFGSDLPPGAPAGQPGGAPGAPGVPGPGGGPPAGPPGGVPGGPPGGPPGGVRPGGLQTGQPPGPAAGGATPPAPPGVAP